MYIIDAIIKAISSSVGYQYSAKHTSGSPVGDFMVASTQSVNRRMCRRYVYSKIAQLAGVSVATVSRVLNHSDTVKAKNRERVLQAIKESNYQPNLLARQLRTARSSMILVMVSNIANPFVQRLLKALKRRRRRMAIAFYCVIPARIQPAQNQR